MEGLPSHVTPIAWRHARKGEHIVNGSGIVQQWPLGCESAGTYLIVEVKPRRVLVVPEHDLPQQFDSLVVGYWTRGEGSSIQQYVAVPYTIEERRD